MLTHNKYLSLACSKKCVSRSQSAKQKDVAKQPTKSGKGTTTPERKDTLRCKTRKRASECKNTENETVKKLNVVITHGGSA